MTKTGRSHFTLFAILAFSFVLASCSDINKILQNPDPNFRLQKAIEFFDAGRYSRSILLLTDIIPAFRGTREAETVNYYFALAHYRIGDNVMASHYFRSFANSFPMSPHTEEFLFLAAYTKYLQSPRSSLDQSSTREAIRDFQTFVNTYPASNRVAEAHQLIDELRLRLEQKVFNQAMLYFNIGDFQAAITTFNNLISDYPGSGFLEEAYFQIVRAGSDFASQSVRDRQLERFRKVIASHNELVRNFPESRFKARSERLYNNARRQIEILN